MSQLWDFWGRSKTFAAPGIEISQTQSLSWSCHLPGGNWERLKLDCHWVWVPVLDETPFSLGIQAQAPRQLHTLLG